ncbi:hypothetical protein ACCQ10_16680 [Xanthomonas sp. NCPPB 1325]|uniref:hypothetical protein n=1 Tax=Xanthomonas sp. NCPPB 1325 TaxID=487529 RepID=UPI0035579297
MPSGDIEGDEIGPDSTNASAGGGSAIAAQVIDPSSIAASKALHCILRIVSSVPLFHKKITKRDGG